MRRCIILEMIRRVKSFEPSDYEKVCDFLIEINKNNKTHINWNWARFEWMYEHPMFDKTLLPLIRLWLDEDKLVAMALGLVSTDD